MTQFQNIWNYNFFRMQEIRYEYFGTRINHIMIFQNLKEWGSDDAVLKICC